MPLKLVERLFESGTTPLEPPGVEVVGRELSPEVGRANFLLFYLLLQNLSKHISDNSPHIHLEQ